MIDGSPFADEEDQHEGSHDGRVKWWYRLGSSSPEHDMGKRETLEHAEALNQGLMDIGRASKASDVSIKMIRHYEAIGLLNKVARTFANYRVYGPNDVHVLRFIRRARTLGFSVDDIRELLSLWQNRSRSSVSVKKVAGKHIEDLKRRICELQAMVDTLEHLTRHCHGDHRPDCPILDDLSSAR
jgi:MerR family transcriptional regulator, copper efflux regulator